MKLGQRKFTGWIVGAIALLTACAGLHKRAPCTNGGEPAKIPPTGGTKQCATWTRPDGQEVIHGYYREWWPNGKLAISGEYYLGKKAGKWQEWDELGRDVSEKYYSEGKEIPRFDTEGHRFTH